MRRRRLVLAAGIAAGWLAAAAAGALEVPFLTGRVNDLAALLNVEEIQRLEAKLAAEETRSGAQVAVLTIPSLEGEALEDYSLRVAQTWKLGKARNDNGVLFLVARDDRKMRIEVGYGLEGTLTDLATGRILDHVVRPLFREGKFGEGIEAGVDSIVGILEGGEPPAEPAGGIAVTGDWAGRLMGFGLYLVVCGVFSMAALFSSGRQSWILYFFLMPFHLMFPIVLHPMLGPILLLSWIVGFPIAKAVLKKTGGGKAPGCLGTPAGTGATGGGGWINSGGWHSSGGGFSSGGGGGFSGGGGSFGGGGSSGSW